MNKKYLFFLVMVIGICSACSLEQEIIILPKNKKKYASVQECIEQVVELVLKANEANRVMNTLRERIDAIQKKGLDLLSDYADGEKDCFLKQANKTERTSYFEKIKKLFDEMDDIVAESYKKAHRLEEKYKALSLCYK